MPKFLILETLREGIGFAVHHCVRVAGLFTWLWVLLLAEAASRLAFGRPTEWLAAEVYVRLFDLLFVVAYAVAATAVFRFAILAETTRRVWGHFRFGTVEKQTLIAGLICYLVLEPATWLLDAAGNHGLLAIFAALVGYGALVLQLNVFVAVAATGNGVRIIDSLKLSRGMIANYLGLSLSIVFVFFLVFTPTAYLIDDLTGFWLLTELEESPPAVVPIVIGLSLFGTYSFVALSIGIAASMYRQLGGPLPGPQKTAAT